MSGYTQDEIDNARAEMAEFEASQEAYGQTFSPFVDGENNDEDEG